MFRLIYVVLMVGTGVGDFQNGSNDVVNDATEFRETAESIDSLRNYLDQNPKDEEAKFELATLLKKVHAYEASQTLLESLLEKHPDFHPAKYELAKLLSTVNQPSVRILKLAHQCVQAEPENEDYLQLLARLQTRLSLWEDALKTYKTLSKLRPNNEDYTYQISLIHHFTGENQKAREALEQHFEQNPNSTSGHALAGRIAFASGDFEKARKHLENAIEIDPSNYLAHEELGKVSMELGDMKKAVQHFEKTVNANPFRLGTTVKYVQVLARAGEREKAKQFQDNIKILRGYDDEKRFFLHHLVDQGAITEEEHALLGKELFRLGFEQEAENHLKAVLGMNPKASSAAYMLAMRAMKNREFQKTLEYLEYVKNPKHQQKENYFILMGLSLYQTGQFDRADEVLHRGLKLHPSSKQLKTIQDMIETQRSLE